MRKQNESRWVERLRARGRGEAWSPTRRSKKKRTREHGLNRGYVSGLGCIKWMAHQQRKTRINSLKKPEGKKESLTELTGCRVVLPGQTGPCCIQYTANTPHRLSFLPFNSGHVSSVGHHKHAKQTHLVFPASCCEWGEKNCWKSQAQPNRGAEKRKQKNTANQILILQHANLNINFYKTYSLDQYSSPKKKTNSKNKVFLSGAPPTAPCTAEHTNVWVMHQTETSNASVTVTQKTILP